MVMDGMRMKALQMARSHQLQLHPDALRRIVAFMGKNQSPASTDEDATAQLMAIFAELKKSSNSRHVSAAAAETCVDKFSATPANAAKSRAVQVVTEFPVHVIDETRTTITSTSKPPNDRRTVLRQRYFLALARSHRSTRYRRANVAAGASDALPLIPVSSLEGLSANVMVGVLGVLRTGGGGSSDGEGAHLEDPKGSVPLVLDFVHAEGAGYIRAGALVIAVGQWRSERFVVHHFDLPPGEPRDRSLAATSGVDMFGLAPTDATGAENDERNAVQAVMVVLAHIHLDVPATLPKLARFFAEFQSRSEAELADMTFVLVGDFCATPIPIGDASHHDDNSCKKTLTGMFDSLASTIHNVAPLVCQQASFVFVPGPNDPTVLAGILPQKPFPASFTGTLRRRLPKAQFATNPCRLRFFTQEIVVARIDALQHARHDCAVPPAAGPETFEHLTRTIVDSGHLLPAAETIAWQRDELLRLWPVPHLLVLCDRTEQWEQRYQGSTVVNPGSFDTGSTFLWYTLADREHTVTSMAA